MSISGLLHRVLSVDETFDEHILNRIMNRKDKISTMYDIRNQTNHIKYIERLTISVIWVYECANNETKKVCFVLIQLTNCIKC